jgi:thiol-disulfide isomerase/thioredoxin
MTSLTTDDIFSDYNKPLTTKVSANFQGSNSICKTKLLDYDSDFYLYESYNRKVRKSIIENLQVKHYIKIGETCPICYDEIIHKKNAFLTDCGHAFHYDCIIEYDYKNSFTKMGIYCPICRGDMGLYDNLKDNNSLNDLENFEMNIKKKLPKVCFDLFRLKYNNHFHRMDYYNCFYCQL